MMRDVFKYRYLLLQDRERNGQKALVMKCVTQANLRENTYFNPSEKEVKDIKVAGSTESVIKRTLPTPHALTTV